MTPPTGIADGSRPAFLISIDTEADNLWSRPREPTTHNAAYLPRFQELCERFDLRPTWLTSYEMLKDPVFVEFARRVLAFETAEIGMHLHAWTTPPIEQLTNDDSRAQPYLFEYSRRLMREKVRRVTAGLEDALEISVVSHRAGRWALNDVYAQILIDEGYCIDCSVTPNVNWESAVGATRGGTNYVRFPDHPYWIDREDIGRPGDSPLLEVPVTIFSARHPAIDRALDVARFAPRPIANRARRLARRVAPDAVWLRPSGSNRRWLLWVLERVLSVGLPHAQLVLHSSELMPGGSPTFPDNESVERLYADLEAVFMFGHERFTGMTLVEFHAAQRPFVPAGPRDIT